MPTGIRAEMAKIFIFRLRGYPGLRLIFMKFRHRDGSAKVRWLKPSSISRWTLFIDTGLTHIRTHTSDTEFGKTVFLRSLYNINQRLAAI